MSITPSKKSPRRQADASLFTGQSSHREVLAQEHTDDFVVQVLDIVRKVVPGMTEDHCRAADQAIRAFGGGDRPYIARRLGDGRSERNAAIRRDHQRGESIPFLMRRYQISRMTVYRALGIGNGSSEE
jgi:Mor family transcriptional regulator